MTNQTVFLPLVLCLLGAIGAWLAAHPAIQSRCSMPLLGWLLALAPFGALVTILSGIARLNAGEALSQQISWLPTLGLNAALYFDGLSALFAVLVTGIGTLVVIYAGYYFAGDASAWRFQTYLLLFMTAMLGLVLAGDVITLFIFWEATSIISFLLVAYKYKDEAARRGAFKALFITGGGGVALLAGLLFVASVAGSYDFQTILTSGDLLRSSPLYGVMLALLALGAFTKSAQTPAHIWLPDAMSAPTPASAYLHSATMVKAGIYLMARFNPVLGNTDAWFWLLSSFGLVTMLVGAYLGLKQFDLKALLAYSTVSQLGALMLLIGQSTPDAYKALVIGIVAHALYKCALFLIVGIVDHEAGTRDLRQLGGLRRQMPGAFIVGSIAALSMAGLPPMFGFLAKETRLLTVTHPTVPEALEILLPAAVVIAGALLMAQAGLLIVDTFGGKPHATLHAHEAPRGMLFAPALPAVISLAIGVLPELGFLAQFFANAASTAHGAPVKVSLALWTGINLPLVLSLIAITLGITLFSRRHQVRALQMRAPAWLSFAPLYTGTLRMIDGGAYLATRTQRGQLRFYLIAMLLGTGTLLFLVGNQSLPSALPSIALNSEREVLRAFTLLLVVTAAAATVMARRELHAILALGVAGLGQALVFALEPAPDVALVQIVVDILTTVVLVLVLTQIQPGQRNRTRPVASRVGRVRDALIATGSGAVVAMISLAALASRPRPSIVTPYYEENAKPLAGATDIVGAIIVDFRAVDTLVEIAVFGMAGVAVFTLLRYAARERKIANHSTQTALNGETNRPQLPASIAGIGGLRTSSFIHALAYVALPMALLIGATHIMYGHDQPGDGFTAGVIVSLAVAFWYVTFGYHHTKRHLHWLSGPVLIGGGLILAFASASLGVIANGVFFSPVNLGEWLGLPLPRGLYLSTAMMFEAAICFTVVGSTSLLLDTLSHPGEEEVARTEAINPVPVAEQQPVAAIDHHAPQQHGAAHPSDLVAVGEGESSWR